MKVTCPICKNTTTWEENPYRPFCSEICKLLDLGKWFSEEYKIEGKEKIAKIEEPRANSKEQGANG
ncbi:MAG: DNA gyrase inhibitor YacG [Nitrospirae bacterium]|jgi:uncharacterized protein|nr:DNA gyrase inhibitor YacG [Nitrospirota bacterium]